MKSPFKITSIITNAEGISIFSEEEFPVEDRKGMFLTAQISAKNFRIRRSSLGYATPFHLSGDATFISILKGSLKIELQNGDYKIFSCGDCFIAKDNLPTGVIFDKTIHGHKAVVVGEENLLATHVKL
jgi:hypothetical protein